MRIRTKEELTQKMFVFVKPILLKNKHIQLVEYCVCVCACVRGCVQIASPACTELEMVVMDWLGELLQLPDAFLSSSGKGGGVIQVTN